MGSRTRILLTLAAAIAVVAAIAAPAASPSLTDVTHSKHFFYALGGQTPQATVADSASNDLVYHGGNVGDGAIGVETSPAVYLVFWGPQWASGFQTADTDGKLYSSKTLQAYIQSFFANVAASPWPAVQTQSCKNLLPAST